MKKPQEKFFFTYVKLETYLNYFILSLLVSFDQNLSCMTGTIWKIMFNTNEFAKDFELNEFVNCRSYDQL